MKRFWTWTLSILLGFEPALWAQGQAEQLSEMKKAIERSRMTQASLKLKDLFNPLAQNLGPEDKLAFQALMKEIGDRKLPKLEATKIKSPKGQEYYRLQGVHDGQSLTIEMINEDGVFARINGRNLTVEDLSSLPSALKAAGVPADEVAQYFPEKSADSRQFLNLDQIRRLKAEDRKKYLKQIRQWVESMEGVEKSRTPATSSSYSEKTSGFELVRWVLQGSPVQAASTVNCLVAGRIVDVESAKGCGVDSNGNVPERFRSNEGTLVCSSPKEILCDQFLYFNGGTGICVKATGGNATQECNTRVNDKNTFDYFNNPTNPVSFAQYREMILAKARVMTMYCDSLTPAEGADRGPASETPKQQPPKRKGQNKASTKAPPTASQQDQCQRFRDRSEELAHWCDQPDLKAEYPALCSPPKNSVQIPVPEVAPSPAPAPAPAPAPPAAPLPKGVEDCGNLPLNMDREQKDCEATGGAISYKECFNRSTNAQERVFLCTCPNDKLIDKMRCAPEIKTDSGTNSGKKGRREKSSFNKKNTTNWLLYGGAMGAMLLLSWWAGKKAVQQYYKNGEQQPQNPPAPPPAPAPTVQPPTPRTGLGVPGSAK